jgi:tripartite-type tricarboxylate transporter receptor subunit TctC
MWQRLLCTALLAHASCGVWAASGKADSYPSKPIRVIVGFPPGGGDDYVARVIGPKLTERFGQPVIVDNRPGVSGNLAAEIAARATPDGYTLMFIASTPLTSSPSLYPRLGYELLKDFLYVARVATGGNVLLAHLSVPVKSLSDLVALARSNPNAIRYGSAGVGSTPHLTMELLQSLTGMQLLHVPYKGGGLAAVALAGGEVDIGFVSITAALPMIQTKRSNALAVSSAKRTGVLPGVPTVEESGVPGYDVANTFGFLAPTGTPASVVRLLNAELRKIVQMDDVKSKLATQGMEAAGGTPDEFRAVIETEVAQWARVIKNARISAK